MKQPTSSLQSGCIVLVLLLVLWQLLSGLLQVRFLPSPLEVIVEIPSLFREKMGIHFYYSLGRIALGMGAAVLGGSLLGYLMGMFPRWNQLLSPLIYFTYPIPKVALLPVVMLLCGLGLLSKTIMIVLIVIFQIILTVRDAVQGIPQEMLAVLHSLGANAWQIFREVIFPGTLPELLTAVRLALGTAISILFFTETYGTQYGIGYFIMDAWMRMNYPEMYAGILLLSLCGFGLFVFLDGLERLCCRWQE